MPEITLEGLAARLEAVEARLDEQRFSQRRALPAKDWRQLVGTMEDNEFTRAVLAEIEAIREADRASAQVEAVEEPPT